MRRFGVRCLAIPLLATAAIGGTAGAAATGELTLVRRLALPSDLADTSDLRFDGSDALLLAVRGVGVVRAEFADQHLGERVVLVPEGRTGGIVIPEMLAASPRFLAVSAPMSQLVWVERKAGGASGALGTWGSPDFAPISFFEDVDVRGDELAIIGLMRAEKGMSPDGAFAWTGRLGGDSVTLRPLAFSLAGKGARPFDACSVFAIGKVRFLDDGRLLLVPGAEPGVYLYAPDGRLLRTWDTAAWGLNLPCDFGDDKLILLNSDVQARLDYVNRFVTVDEVLPTGAGPALLVRWVEGDGTHWKMVLLAEDGSSRTFAVPLGAPSRRAHLRGDVDGDRILLVLRDFLAEPGRKKTASELVEFHLQVDAKRGANEAKSGAP